MAKLVDIEGIGPEYATLLGEVGVDSPAELSARKARDLHKRLVEINQKKKLVRRPPTQAQVEQWIARANEVGTRVKFRSPKTSKKKGGHKSAKKLIIAEYDSEPTGSGEGRPGGGKITT